MITQTSAPTLNPWFSIWVRPRATVRQIIETDPNKQVMLLTALYGIVNTFSNASAQAFGDRLPFLGVIGLCIVLGAVGGVIGLFISSAVFAWIGRKLGGQGQTAEVRTAIAWSCVPTIWAGTLIIPQLLIFGEELFMTETPRIAANPGLALVLSGFAVIEFVIAIWNFVVFLHCLGEAHRFSAWRALGTTVLAILLIISPILCVAIGVLTLLGTGV